MSDAEKLQKCLDFIKEMTYDVLVVNEGQEDMYYDIGDGQDYVDGASEFYNWIIKQ